MPTGAPVSFVLGATLGLRARFSAGACYRSSAGGFAYAPSFSMQPPSREGLHREAHIPME